MISQLDPNSKMHFNQVVTSEYPNKSKRLTNSVSRCIVRSKETAPL